LTQKTFLQILVQVCDQQTVAALTTLRKGLQKEQNEINRLEQLEDAICCLKRASKRHSIRAWMKPQAEMERPLNRARQLLKPKQPKTSMTIGFEAEIVRDRGPRASASCISGTYVYELKCGVISILLQIVCLSSNHRDFELNTRAVKGNLYCVRFSAFKALQSIRESSKSLHHEFITPQPAVC
jgi:hypothetical protein